MPDLKLDAQTHDLIFESGDFKITRVESESLVQRLKIKLSTWSGEWFLDTTLGVPYFETIFKKGTAKETIDNIFKVRIVSEPEVEALLSFESSIDKTFRIYSLVFTVRSSNGVETIPIELQF